MTIRSGRIAVWVILAASAAVSRADDVATTATGWFADEKCASSRAADGRAGPPGRSCTQECIRKGVPVVFIDEKSKALFRVSNPAVTRGQECNHVQITGTLNERSKTVRVAAVKVLDPYVAKCDVK